MSTTTTTDSPDIINYQKIRSLINPGSNSVNIIKSNPVLKILDAENSEDFANYIDGLGLAKDPNMVILSSQHHYYYDAEEIKNVNTVINIKQLNQIKQIKSFLHSIFHNLPHGSNFIGCFVDNNNTSGYNLNINSSNYHNTSSFDNIENGIVSQNPFLNMLFSKMDLRTNKYMSKRNVTILLNDHGFKVLNMTDLNGLTYFCAQKLRTADN